MLLELFACDVCMWEALHIARGCFKLMEGPRGTYVLPFAHLKRRFRKPPRPRDVNADEDEIITSTNMSNNVKGIAFVTLEACPRCYDSKCTRILKRPNQVLPWGNNRRYSASVAS